VGYADGYLRSLSNRGHAFLGDFEVPVVGRVSMDLVTLDVTAVPDEIAHPGAMVEVISERYPVDTLGADAGTIGYEILTSLGARYARRYVSAGA
jgi:alanine racemase